MKKFSLIFTQIVFLLFLNSCSEAPKESKAPKLENQQVSKEVSSKKPKQLIVYYFHTTYRCQTCNLFESLTKEVLLKEYKNELDNEIINFKSVNIEDEGGQEYIEKYQLLTKSIVLSLRDKEKETAWQNMDAIWTVIGDQEKFKIYIKEGIAAQLAKI